MRQWVSALALLFGSCMLVGSFSALRAGHVCVALCQVLSSGGTAPSTLNTDSSAAIAAATSVNSPTPPTLRGTVRDYPKLANLYAYGTGAMDQPITYSHYGLVVANPSVGPDGKLALLKTANPSTLALAYIDSTAVPAIPGFGGENIVPQWWLTYAGTTLRSAISNTTTSIPVVDASAIQSMLLYDHQILVDQESMNVVSVNTSTNILTVTRGYLSSATAHLGGAHTAVHASNWPGAWMINLTAYCPVVNGLTAEQYLAQYARWVMADGPWDGIFYDNANAAISGAFTSYLDTNGDNQGDGGVGWAQGEAALFLATSAALPGIPIMGNGPGAQGPSWAGETGQEFEHFPNYLQSWSQGLALSRSLTNVIVNVDTANTGTINLQAMRFGLGTALLGNSWYAYDDGTQEHGNTWWFDEYDGGEGSSLVADVNITQTSITLAAGSGSRFRVGDILWVSNGEASLDDEQMLVKSVKSDILTVQRGYNGSSSGAHQALMKVETEAQRSSGQGWLGQPRNIPISLGTNQYRRDFAHGIVLVNGDTKAHTYTLAHGYRHLLGTQDPTLNNGAAVTAVTVPAQDAVVLAKF